MKKLIIFLLLIKCNLVIAGDAILGSTLYSLDLSSNYSCYTMTPADFQRIKKLRHLVAKPEQLEIYVKTTLPLRTNFSAKQGLVYQSLRDENKFYISGMNTLLKIGAEDPTVPGSNEIPDYHRDSVSFSNRCGMGAVRIPALAKSVTIHSRLNR